MLQDGLYKVISGFTTTEEILKQIEVEDEDFGKIKKKKKIFFLFALSSSCSNFSIIFGISIRVNNYFFINPYINFISSTSTTSFSKSTNI